MVKTEKLLVLFLLNVVFFAGCKNSGKEQTLKTILMKEKQITFSDHNHVLDNNDNFSPDDRFLCYDTRGTVFNEDIGNCKSIEKVEIATGKETVLYAPEAITGEKAAPGVGAVSCHPTENSVVFIHGPFVDEVQERGYYDKPNRTGFIVVADGSQRYTKADMRDVATDRPTTPGAHRGGTHRHEYSRNGNRIGFTYDDLLSQEYARTIGYMEKDENAPAGYSHYFALLVKPAKKGESKPGEIEMAQADSWVDKAGTMRAFIGKVRAADGVNFEEDLFVVDVPETVDITTAFSGNGKEYPTPPEGLKVRRLTHGMKAGGIVRGSYNGKFIAFYAPDKNSVEQIFIIPADGSDKSEHKNKHPRQVTFFKTDASFLRWHPSDKWILSVVNGNIAASYVGDDNNFGKTFLLTNDTQNRDQLVISHSGNKIAYGINIRSEKQNRDYKQIFVMDFDREELFK
jgi:hypothetical protein